MLLVASLLSLNPGLFFWTVLAFLLLLGLLGKFAWPAILGGLKEREANIEESMMRAEKAAADSARIQASLDSQRQEAGREAQAILREAREQATQMRDADVEKTKAEIARMQAQAAADIDRQKQQAIAELRSEVAALAIGAAEKILSVKIDAAEQSRLVDRFIADTPTN